MDHSLFQFAGSSSNLHIQQSKLATYMKLNVPNHQPNISHGVETIELLESPETQTSKMGDFDLNRDMVNNIYFTSSDVIPSSPSRSPDIFPVDNRIVPANVQVHQENVGGTTYFFPTNDSVSNGNHGIPPHIYPNVSRRNIPVGPKSLLTSSVILRENYKSEMLQKLAILHSVPEIADLTLPPSVEDYVDLFPLEQTESNDGVVRSSTYRVTQSQSGLFFVLRRLHDFNFPFNKLPLIIEQWKKLNHPNLVQLHEVFSTKNFGDQSLVFIYDYYPGSITLLNKYMMVNRVGIDDMDPFNSDPDAPRPYTHKKNTILRATHGGNYMPENLIWNTLVQITGALRTIHSAGLSCWYLDPSKIIVTGSTVRLSWPGINEIIKVASSGSAGLSITTEEAQQEDLMALGRMVLGLVCQSSLPIDPRVINIYMQTVTRDYSIDLKNLIMYLLSSSPPKPKNLIDLMPMIGARFYNYTETLQRHVHALEDQLSVEFDNGRLYRILIKLNTVVDRPGLNIDQSWAETGDRYILKLFRDYIFHSVTPEGRPWLDNAHIVNCLNHLECGSFKKVQLESRNERSVLIVSFHELNICLERAFAEVLQAAASP